MKFYDRGVLGFLNGEYIFNFLAFLGGFCSSLSLVSSIDLMPLNRKRCCINSLLLSFSVSGCGGSNPDNRNWSNKYGLSFLFQYLGFSLESYVVGGCGIGALLPLARPIIGSNCCVDGSPPTCFCAFLKEYLPVYFLHCQNWVVAGLYGWVR